ncbi:hypothetical protein LOTGIDRAFT_120422 [Lottia gigantea]|uniref:Beta-hexosaminidase n=1 Tax=Lottia gigantea TaxID=225164 RepID=V3ZMB9_LOTGI|nr:hypothetical protein LOTGIDRAFT_120422 [Lottia gigantea]ESO92513.1 hypothetical protein LOTGIDRAFT_120422 [Lottia gigantea]
MASSRQYLSFVFVIIFLCISQTCCHYETSQGNSPLYSQTNSNTSKLKLTSPTTGAPWPMPQSYNVKPDVNVINVGNFKFVHGKYQCMILDEAFIRYYKLIFNHNENFRRSSSYKILKFESGITQLEVLVNTPCKDNEYFKLDTDESYNIKISKDSAVLNSKTVWGALRGLETFSQIIYHDKLGQYVVNTTTISDHPRFPHRGLLLDTSRHFVSKNILLQNLDAMAQNKFNVFHWHIVDDPSFPYESIMFPELSQKGAYDPETHVYTQSDIQEIIEYARLRGIRVVPEFDTPGHTQSWGKAQTDLLTKCYTKGQPNGQFGPIDPVNNATYTFLQKFFSEIANVFPDQYIHLGGDEVSFNCWASNPAVKEFIKKMGFFFYGQVEEYYMQKLLDIVGRLGKGYQIWQEVIDNGAKVRPDTVVEVWKSGWEKEMDKVTKMGYKTLLASCWYLDMIKLGDWQSFYVCDPFNFPGNASQKKLIQGGEACLWGEFVDDTNLMSRLWPRASAVGERLWSNQTVSIPFVAQPRLEEHRCRMVGRGFPAEPATGPGFCKEEYIHS